MEANDFFGFDASSLGLPPEDDDGGGLDCEDDDDFDALNDETFGSAAVGGDWEENHKQLSTLTEAEKSQRSRQESFSDDGLQFHLRNLCDDNLRRTLENFSLENNSEKKRLFERTLSGSELSSSPGNSIWSPSQLEIEHHSDDVKQQRNHCSSLNNQQAAYNKWNQQYNNSNSFKISCSPNSLSELQKTARSVKTVEELEQELKRYHGSQQQSQPNSLQTFNKLSAITVEDLEREITRQAVPTQSSSKLQLNATFPRMTSSSQAQNIHYAQSQFPGSGPCLAQFIPSQQQQQRNFNAGFSKPFGGDGKGTLPYYTLLNTNANKFGPAAPSLNSSNGMYKNFPQNRFIGPFPPQHQFNQRPPLNRMTENHRGSFQSGNMQNRNQNFQRYNGLDRKPYEQNCRPDQHWNYQEHHRERNMVSHLLEGSGGGNRVRRDSDAEWEEWHRIRQIDPYSGLMTPKEKNWLRNIQAMQLQSDNSYQDDYYYIMLDVRQQRRREEEVIEIDGLQLLEGDRGKEGKEYEPPRLENSLGKLQVASVNAPRKIIDLHVVHLDSSHPATSLQKDMRKHRHLLLHIEKLYNIQIELDDLERKIRALPDCPTRDSFRSKCRQLVTKLWNGLTDPHETFVQLLCIRKGKTLAARLVTWVSESEVEHLLATIIQNLSLLTKKDTHDKKLLQFWPAADKFFASLNASCLVNFGIMMGTQLKPQKNQFVPAVDSKLGFSIVLALLVQGENLWPELTDDSAWLHFLKDVISALCVVSTSGDKSKLHPLPSATLAASLKHPATHIARHKSMETASLTKAVEVLSETEAYLMNNTPLVLGSGPLFNPVAQKQVNSTDFRSSFN